MFGKNISYAEWQVLLENKWISDLWQNSQKQIIMYRFRKTEQNISGTPLKKTSLFLNTGVYH